MDTWHDVGHTSNLNLSWDKRGINAKKSPFFLVLIERNRRAKASSQDLRSSVGRFSSVQERKFIASTRGTRGHLEKGISLKIQEGRFREIEVVGFRWLPTCYHAPRGKGFFLAWLTFHLWVEKIGFFVKGPFSEEKLDFQVLFDVSSPMRIEVRLGEGVNLLKEDWFFA